MRFHECLIGYYIRLDELLGGGVYTGELLEIVGQVSSGKTQVRRDEFSTAKSVADSFVALHANRITSDTLQIGGD